MYRHSPSLMPKWILLTSIVTFLVGQATAFECAGVSYPFGILPKEEPYVRYGDSLELYCMLNVSHKLAIGSTSENLSFFTTGPNGRILLNHTKVNETTIRTVIDNHYLENLPRRACYIYCSLKLYSSEEERNCATYVRVGLEPQDVKNFTCISYNWERLECKWYPPETYIDTEYNVSVAVVKQGSPGKPLEYYECPKVPNTTNMCEITRNTATLYRQHYEYFSFQVIGKNRLGTHKNVIRFNHFANVKPNRTLKFSVVNATSDSLLVNWTIPLPVNRFPPGVYPKIEYRSEWDPPDKWNTVLMNRATGRESGWQLYNITGLKYAHTMYTIRIYLKSGAAKNDNLWSEPTELTHQTLPAIPARAPSTTFGSYEVNSGEEGVYVYVYWKSLPEKFQNGDGFTYKVTCLMNNKYDCGSPLNQTSTYAKYSIAKNNEYLFTIYSVNNIGRSRDSSTVFVPKLNSIPRPESFTDIRYANGVRELSWKPFEHKNLSNYTIFWCEQNQSLRLPCKGIIDWMHVDKNVTVKNITMKSITKFYDVAIAANLKDGSSSGMVWFSCVVTHDRVNEEFSHFFIGNVGSREANILWDMKCAPSPYFFGYYLYYCPVLRNNKTVCQDDEAEKRKAVKGTGMKNETLSHLKPNTVYRVQISIRYDDGTQEKIGSRSEMKWFETKEDAPSEPLYLKAENVTNSSITLTWHPPTEPNGKLTRYDLNIKSNSANYTKSIKETHLRNALTTKYELTDLKSYTWYNMTLSACTGNNTCSNPSVRINVKTRAGVPGEMTRPHITTNNTATIVTWEKPRVAAGDLNYYELSIINDSNKKIMNFTGTWGEIPLADCDAAFRVRAVNIDGSDVYRGRWSESVVGHCDPADQLKSMALLIWLASIFFLFMVTAILFYIVKRGWLHCRKMKDVEVKLPPGLQSQDLEKDNQDYLHLDPWPPRPNDTIQSTLGPNLAPDEESLLGKKSDECLDPFNIGVKNGGDSSGCSMGRESMSSSVASDNHGSSDSGAEADQCTNAMRVPFGEWNSVKAHLSNAVDDPTKNHIRKDTHPEDPLNFSTVDWNPDDPAVPGYTRVGFTDGPATDKSLPGKGYVTIANIPSLTAMPGIPPQKPVTESSYNSLPMDSFPLLFNEDSRTPVPPEAKGLGNPQTNAPPSYVTLTCLQEHRLDGTTVSPAGLNASRPFGRESEKCQNDGAHVEPSAFGPPGNAAEETPLARSNGPMPPYVSMIEKPAASTEEEDEDEEEDEEEKKKKEEEEEEEEEKAEEIRLSPDLGISSKKTVRGIDSALVDRISKDTESYSNYIPHHVFGKESLHTQ